MRRSRNSSAAGLPATVAGVARDWALTLAEPDDLEVIQALEYSGRI